MKNQITKMSENGETYHDINNPRFFLMVDISPSRKNEGEYFFYASTVNGKVMFTVDGLQLLSITQQFMRALPKELQSKVKIKL